MKYGRASRAAFTDTSQGTALSRRCKAEGECTAVADRRAGDSFAMLVCRSATIPSSFQSPIKEDIVS